MVQEAGWAPELFLTGEKNLASTGIRSSDRPSCSESRLLLILLLKFKNIFDKERSILIRCETHLRSCEYIHSVRGAPTRLQSDIFSPITTVATSFLTSTRSPLTHPPQK